jgi:glycosyltransferase involved in cell wall biosynthesis
MKSIGFLINGLATGGAERALLRDANEFARRGYAVCFCMLYGDPGQYLFEKELEPSVRIVYIRAKNAFSPNAVRRVIAACRQSEVTTLITTLNDANLVGRWVALLSLQRIRLFIREANDPSRKLLWQRLMSLLFDGLATKIIAVSEQTRTSLLRDAPWRSNKIVVVRNSVEIPAKILRGTHEPVRILAVGNLTDQKDYPTLIRALEIVKKRGIAFEARIVGAGAVRGLPELSEPLGEQVRFLGQRTHADVEDQMRDADVFVLSSAWEGCPNVVLEAMAHSLPVVATAVGGVPELVQDNVTGLLVPPKDPLALADALARACTSDALRAQLGEAAYARACSDFSVEARFKNLSQLLFGTV